MENLHFQHCCTVSQQLFNWSSTNLFWNRTDLTSSAQIATVYAHWSIRFIPHINISLSQQSKCWFNLLKWARLAWVLCNGIALHIHLVEYKVAQRLHKKRLFQMNRKYLKIANIREYNIIYGLWNVRIHWESRLITSK